MVKMMNRNSDNQLSGRIKLLQKLKMFLPFMNFNPDVLLTNSYSCGKLEDDKTIRGAYEKAFDKWF